MKRYTISAAESFTHVPAHPERTARRQASTVGLNFDVVYQVWPNRASLARSVRMQEKRAPRADDWRPVVRLGETEGY